VKPAHSAKESPARFHVKRRRVFSPIASCAAGFALVTLLV